MRSSLVRIRRTNFRQVGEPLSLPTGLGEWEVEIVDSNVDSWN